MSNRRHDIDARIQHLRKLESQFVDQKTLDGIKALIAGLEEEKASLEHDRRKIPVRDDVVACGPQAEAPGAGSSTSFRAQHPAHGAVYRAGAQSLQGFLVLKGGR